MRVVIWAGGKGTRLEAETRGRIPKPMVDVGGRPMIQHIMQMYLSQGFGDFTILTGYLGEMIEEWVDVESNSLRFPHQCDSVEAVYTGEETQTGGRLARIREQVPFPIMATYGDGLSDINFRALLDHHERMREEAGVLVTLTAVHPPARFGALRIEDGLATVFAEKMNLDDGWINGGFYVIEEEAIDFIISDEAQWETDVLPILAHQGRLAAYQHPGWWRMCDTPRDLAHLQEIWESGDAPWTRWFRSVT